MLRPIALLSMLVLVGSLDARMRMRATRAPSRYTAVSRGNVVVRSNVPYHTHTCATCGTTWDHTAHPGHNCPNCGREQLVQDSRPRPVTAAAAVQVAPPITTMTPTSLRTGAAESEALAEVNAVRAKRGLKPYIFDPNLTAGALQVARHRAAHLIAGHTRNDFNGLPSGVSARAAGCAAWPPSLGWGACATYDNFTYAGAAWCLGRDGKRYMHLFVR
jgi:predicted RNA-binding Zn-ribbon protein involved in translation (DUF1610 family)